MDNCKEIRLVSIDQETEIYFSTCTSLALARSSEANMGDHIIIIIIIIIIY